MLVEQYIHWGRLLSTVSCAGIVAFSSTAARADENPFGYTYTADVLPKGKWELEHWMTGRIGKETGSFLGTDFRTEIETGLTDHLQASLYLNYNYFYIKNATASSGPLENKNRFGISGTSAEFKYQVLSPYKDSFGHGTFVAGLAASNGASSNGLYKGEAPGANLVAIKVSGANGAVVTSTVIQGVDWAVAKATGLGLALNLKTWTARPDGGSRWLAASLDEMPEAVLVSDLDTVTDAFAAVAVTGAGEAPAVTVRDAVPG